MFLVCHIVYRRRFQHIGRRFKYEKMRIGTQKYGEKNANKNVKGFCVHINFTNCGWSELYMLDLPHLGF